MINIRKLFFLILFFATQTLLFAQQKDFHFEVIFKGEKIGTMHATEKVTGTKSIKNLTIETDTKFVLLNVHTESEVTSTYINGVLIQGVAYRDANHGLSDVHSRITKTGPKLYQKERNGIKETISGVLITFCVIDLYFKEPKGVTQIFSTMYGQMLTLKKISLGNYQLITPDNQDSFYTYKDGKLIVIKATTTVGEIISKRI